MPFVIRDFETRDAAQLNAVVLAAWAEFEPVFKDFAGLARRLGDAARLAATLELIVAERAGSLVGAVGYVPPQAEREAMFPPEWALIRLLSVAPEARGRGIGRRLSEECIARAGRASAIGLHTSPAMRVALPLYLALGFRHERDIPERNGVAYALYKLPL